MQSGLIVGCREQDVQKFGAHFEIDMDPGL